MISLRFADFYIGNYEDLGYELYMIKNLAEVLYIGISKNGIWHRWFDPYIGHFARGSKIARRIKYHRPQSDDWIIELWRLEDCLQYLKPELANFPKKQIKHLSIKYCEELMIRKFTPIDNIDYNPKQELDNSEFGLADRSAQNLYEEIWE